MKSEKSIRSELATLATVLAVPFAIAAIFPYGALSFRARTNVVPKAFAAFVTLTESETAAAVKAAKTSLIGDAAANSHRIRAELPFGVLPESEGVPVLGLSDRSRLEMPPAAELGPTPYLPSRADSAPAAIPHDPRTDEQPFTRAELLKL